MATFPQWVWVVVWTQFVLFLSLLSPTKGQKVFCPSRCRCLGDFFDCARAGLTEVPKDIPPWAKTLELQHNDIADINEHTFRNLTNLVKIDLSHNKISRLENTTFRRTPVLETLKLAHNQLREIPNLGFVPKLEDLSLARNRIRVLLPYISEYPSLRSLDLSFNRISAIPGGIFTNSSRLVNLSLNSNRISRIEKGSLDNLTRLKSLSLNRNKLAHLPKDLFLQLHSLVNLELNKNRIEEIEGLIFKGLASLKSLSLRHNNIGVISDGAFFYLGNVRSLNLDSNNLTMVTKGMLYGLTALESLNLTSNNITEVGMDGWEYCQNLATLDLTLNRLQAITKSTFARAASLVRLFLDHNIVSYIEEGAFKSLHRLQELHLNHNEISWTMEDTRGPFLGLNRLVHLGLGDNLIKSLTGKAFSGLGRLEVLDLSHNPITTIHQNTFLPLQTSLRDLRLDTNNLLCDCNLRWLPAWIASMGFQAKVSLYCGHPENLRHRAVLNLHLNNFTCDGFQKPEILESPESKIALKGQNLTLICKASSTSGSTLEFQWRKEQKLFTDGETELFQSAEPGDRTVFTSHLHLRDIQNKDEGHYQCVIRNQFGSVYSNQSYIRVYVYPTFVKQPADVMMPAGKTARLECGAQGQPAPVVAWQKDGGDQFPAARERRMHVMPTDDVFYVVALKPQDSGVYTCTATNPAGTIKASATLTVLERPAFVRPMQSKQVKAGQSAVLECFSSGSPKPSLSWLKDGTPLIATERHFFAAESQLLVIIESEPSDSGEYTCEMSNKLGVERGISLLKVVPEKSSGLAAHGTTTGIVVIVVVVCVVGTSLVWVIIIYKTRKSRRQYGPPGSAALQRGGPEHPTLEEVARLPVGEHTALQATDTTSEGSGHSDGSHQESEELVDSGSRTYILGPSNFRTLAPAFVRDDGIGSQSGDSNAHTPPTPRATSSVASSFGPRAIGRLPDVLVHRMPPGSPGLSSLPAAASPRSLSEGFLVRSPSRDRHGRRRLLTHGASVSSDGSAVTSSSDERDSGFSTFPRSVRTWSSASLQCRLRPRDVTNESSLVTVSGEDPNASPQLEDAIPSSRHSLHTTVEVSPSTTLTPAAITQVERKENDVQQQLDVRVT
ncbi:leucine-rich repeats and immunoglobulin-like domains protein 3 [Ornithodoros turicata]|uniref:leucine-rich repeats and immunoglobulin-like domains protein 3 n=1 Tax=Ornithodoros turicata TaxID=34597 RepID=UPI003139B810